MIVEARKRVVNVFSFAVPWVKPPDQRLNLRGHCKLERQRHVKQHRQRFILRTSDLEFFLENCI